MDWKLEVVVLPVADIDRAKAFYVDQVGFDVQVDYSAGEDFRVVHLIPRGSAVAVALMRNEAAAGSVSGLHLVVNNIDTAWQELTERGAGPDEIHHYVEGAPAPGADPNRADYGSFLSFSDPDGNQWLVQEVGYSA
ncbi:MAG TPA: VOC family protein [Acidimicrobiales bacterium]|jgi:catechol 2,3-dioxygenase-like lactoylglutathione lyase family enzyme|nr:VOC family protein [Acidimicrobiales bacterium]